MGAFLAFSGSCRIDQNTTSQERLSILDYSNEIFKEGLCKQKKLYDVY